MFYQYSIELDVDDNRAYTNGLCALENVRDIQWAVGMNAPYAAISNPATMQITLANNDGRYALDNPAALYYGKIFPGRLIRVRMMYNGTTVTMTELRITTTKEDFGEFILMPILVIHCEDKIRELLAFEYAPKLQQNVRVDEVLTELHKTARVVWPNNRGYFFIDVDSIDGPQLIYDVDDTDFEQAVTTLEWAGDHLGQTGQGNAQRLIRDLMKAEIFGMYFFQPRTGLYRFLNRHHATNAVSSYTLQTGGGYLTSAQPKRGLNPYGEGPLNRMVLDYMPRSTGATASILYSSDSVPFVMRANTTKKIRGRFFDPDNENARVGGVDVILPQDNVDITANSLEDGTGDDKVALLSISREIKASSIEFTIENKTAERIWVTKLQCRGTPLISFKKETIEARNVDSLHAYDPFEQNDSVILADESIVQAMGDMLVNLFGTPRLVLERITLALVDGTATHVLDAVQDLTIGDCITVQNTNQTHDKDYIIVGELHRANVSAGRHEVTYVLRAAEYNHLFMIDSSVIDGTDILDV